jgi:aminomethyltransferase
MAAYNGWEMPIEYPGSGGLIAEHLAVRTGVGIFDVSHMGDIRIQGPQALAAVQHITINDASRLAVNQCQYSAMLYPAGTFVDDLILHKLAEDDYLIAINAGTREKDWAWVSENVRGFACRAEDVGGSFTQIAIQGPKAIHTLQKLTDADLSQVKSYWFTHGTVCGLKNIMIARTGYTAEDGFEIYLPPEETAGARVWRELREASREFGGVYCGLGARNTLRLEGKLPLYGHEISAEITVWEAGLHRVCKLEKPEFIGKAALEQLQAQGVKRTLAGLEMVEPGIARDGYKVVDQAGQAIGYVTSGSYAPFLKKNIALAYVPVAAAVLDNIVSVEIRGRMVRAKIVPTPFYKRGRT